MTHCAEKCEAVPPKMTSLGIEPGTWLSSQPHRAPKKMSIWLKRNGILYRGDWRKIDTPPNRDVYHQNMALGAAKSSPTLTEYREMDALLPPNVPYTFQSNV